jgi:hypothetical protein
MKRFLIFIAIGSLLLFTLSLIITGVFPFYPADFYAFTVPFMIVSFGSFLLALIGILIRKAQKFFFITSLILFALLVAPYAYAISQWPGGDDGPGMAWTIFVGGGAFLAAIFGFFVLLYYLAKKFHVREI